MFFILPLTPTESGLGEVGSDTSVVGSNRLAVDSAVEATFASLECEQTVKKHNK